MSLDVRIKSMEPVLCPHCGKVAGYEEKDKISVGGKNWYSFLEEIGYYPEEKWYCKNMSLTQEQTKKLVEYAKEYAPYIAPEIKTLVSEAIFDGNDVVINADW